MPTAQFKLWFENMRLGLRRIVKVDSANQWLSLQQRADLRCALLKCRGSTQVSSPSSAASSR